MKKPILFILLMLVVCTPILFSASFEEEKTKTADGEDFLFPSDGIQNGPAIFALTMGKNRENGSAQQKEVIAWQQYFTDNPSFVGTTPVYHFPVLSGVPFFVKGTIRKALYDYYSEIVDPSRVGVLFVSKTEKFVEQAGIPFDEESALVVVGSDGTIAGFVKGGVTPAKVEQLQKVLALL